MNCEVCKEPVRYGEDSAELYLTNSPELGSLLVHDRCGFDWHMEVA